MKCIFCDKELEPDEEETGTCSTCYEVMQSIHPKSKLKWRLKCHKENAKKLKLRKQEQ